MWIAINKRMECLSLQFISCALFFHSLAARHEGIHGIWVIGSEANTKATKRRKAEKLWNVMTTAHDPFLLRSAIKHIFP